MDLISHVGSTDLRGELTKAKEKSSAHQTALVREQRKHAALQAAVREACNAFGPSEGQPEGSSLIGRLRACYEQARTGIREALHTGVKRAMAVIRSHYVVDLEIVSEGFADAPKRSSKPWTRRRRCPTQPWHRSSKRTWCHPPCKCWSQVGKTLCTNFVYDKLIAPSRALNLS